MRRPPVSFDEGQIGVAGGVRPSPAQVGREAQGQALRRHPALSRESRERRHHPGPQLGGLIGGDHPPLVIQPRIAEPLDHVGREAECRVGGQVSRRHDLLEQDVTDIRAQAGMLRGLAHRPHAREERERRGRGVRAVQQPQFAVSVEPDVAREDHRLGEDIDGKRRPQFGGVRLDGPERVRLSDGEQGVAVPEPLLERSAHVRGGHAGGDPIHERGTEPHPSPQPLAEFRPASETAGQGLHHRGEPWPVVVHQLGGDHEHGRTVRQALETRVQQIGQPRREARLRAKPRLGHVAHDHLQLRSRDEVAHRWPLGVGEQRTRDRSYQPCSLDRCSVLEPALHQREQAVLGVDGPRLAPRRALNDGDSARERAGRVRGVYGRRAQRTQQHARPELQHALREVLPAVGPARPVRRAQARKFGSASVHRPSDGRGRLPETCSQTARLSNLPGCARAGSIWHPQPTRRECHHGFSRLCLHLPRPAPGRARGPGSAAHGPCHLGLARVRERFSRRRLDEGRQGVHCARRSRPGQYRFVPNRRAHGDEAAAGARRRSGPARWREADHDRGVSLFRGRLEAAPVHEVGTCVAPEHQGDLLRVGRRGPASHPGQHPAWLSAVRQVLAGRADGRLRSRQQPLCDRPRDRRRDGAHEGRERERHQRHLGLGVRGGAQPAGRVPLEPRQPAYCVLAARPDGHPAVLSARQDSLYPNLVPVRYPKAGTPNSTVKIGVVEVATGRTSWINLGAEPDIYVAAMDFADSPTEVWLTRLNRHQNRLDVLLADATTGTARVITSDSDSAWVDANQPRWIAGGKQFLLVSEREGYDQVYLFNRDGSLVRRVTPGGWDVFELLGVDEQSKVVYVTGAIDGPLGRPVLRIGLDGKGLTRVSTEPGTHGVSFDPSCRLYVDTYSRAGVPPVETLRRADGTLVRPLAGNLALVRKVDALRLRAPEFLKVPTPEGVELNAWIIKPQDFDPTKRYPLLMFVYGGPGSQTVTDAWGGPQYLWHQMLAQEGYVVANVDNRGTGGRGAKFMKMTYLHLGRYESADQIAAARWFGQQPFVSAERIGIWGWSYGGYMTSRTVFLGGGLFKAAIAVAPVTDWRFYDTIYTERYMRTPGENPSGYVESAPLTYADSLKSSFLLVHGTGDDNVHFQNSERLVQRLEAANKQFDMRIYPNKTHSIAGGTTRENLYGLFTAWLKAHL